MFLMNIPKALLLLIILQGEQYRPHLIAEETEAWRAHVTCLWSQSKEAGSWCRNPGLYDHSTCP